MNITGPGVRLSIALSETASWHGQPLYRAIVELARARGVAGATVYRGIEGYGVHRLLHSLRLLDISDDLPMLLEIVDRRDRIETLLPELHAMLASHGLCLTTPVEIIRAGGGV